MLETSIGLIPLLLHEVAKLIMDGSGIGVVGNAGAETCFIGIVASFLALLSLLRDWERGKALRASWFTGFLAIVNILTLIAGAFLSPFVIVEPLTQRVAGAPTVVLVAALIASFLLAAERGFSSER